MGCGGFTEEARSNKEQVDPLREQNITASAPSQCSQSQGTSSSNTLTGLFSVTVVFNASYIFFLFFYMYIYINVYSTRGNKITKIIENIYIFNIISVENNDQKLISILSVFFGSS